MAESIGPERKSTKVLCVNYINVQLRMHAHVVASQEFPLLKTQYEHKLIITYTNIHYILQ